ncbi:hypothetical protein ASC93_00880 [Massilia sp. Root335]|nr:hypothetical protein ASC93_00880 [Massilia sp. Root335]
MIQTKLFYFPSCEVTNCLVTPNNAFWFPCGTRSEIYVARRVSIAISIHHIFDMRDVIDLDECSPDIYWQLQFAVVARVHEDRNRVEQAHQGVAPRRWQIWIDERKYNAGLECTEHRHNDVKSVSGCYRHRLFRSIRQAD